MQENDFEKQVHQKMGELNIVPSEAVWEQVEMRLHPKEKRRFWIILLPLLFTGLLLGGYILLNNQFSSSNSKKIKTVSEKSFQSHTNDNKPGRNSTGNAASKTNNPQPRLGTNENLKSEPVEEAPGNEPDRSKPFHQKNNEGLQQQAQQQKLKHVITGLPGRKKNFIKTSDRININPLDVLLKSNDALGQASNQKIKFLPGITATDQFAENKNDKELLPVTINAIPNLVNPPNTSVLSIKEDQAGVKINTSHYKNWEWGFSVQGGRSSLASGTSFNTIFGGALNYSANSSLANASTSSGLVYKQPYPLRASVGFAAGAFFKKRFSGRFSISVGINYSSYNTTNKIGLKVDSSLSLPSVFNDNRTQTYNQYFRSGDTGSYTNKYHFIEVPVILQTQLTRHWKMPIYWDLGFSLSRLLTSNALYFNNSKGVYYKDNQLLNKNQLNIITGFPVKIASGKKFELQVGPELRYGLSHVMAKELTPGKHFLFLGLKVGIVLGKK